MLSAACFLAATQAFCAPTVSLAWDANPESDIAGYELSYGDASGIYPTSINAGNSTTVDVTGLTEGKTYYFVVAAYNSAGLKSLPSSQISYAVPLSGSPIPSDPTLRYVDSEETNGYPAVYAFDGDANTFWHTEFRTNVPPPPHELQIDLGSVQNLRGFRYLPRQDGTSYGNISRYEFYMSADGLNWGTPVASGTFINSSAFQEIPFVTASGRYVRLRALSEINGLNQINVAELTFLQADSIPPDGTNTAPSAIAQTLGTAEDSPFDISLTGADLEGSALSYAVVTGPENGTLTGIAPNLTYSPAANFSGSDSFTFRVNDGTANSANATVLISVTPVNDVPVAQAKSVTTVEGTPVAVPLSGTDIENSPLTFAIVTGPTKGMLSGTAPNLTYTPSADATGSDSFTFRVNDGTANSANATVSITITSAPNTAPVAIAKSVTTAEDTPLAVIIAGTDAEGDTLTYSVVTSPTKGTLSGSAPNLTYTPSADATGSDSFTFRANDGTVNSATATVSITVTAVNDTPVASGKSVTTAEDTPVAVMLSGSDIENSPLTFAIVTGPNKGTLSGTPPNLTYTPTADAVGSDSFTFRVNDGTVNSANATISITVTAVNDTPVATSKTVTTTEDTPLAIVLSGSDKDLNTLTFSVVTGPSNGTLTGTPPNLSYSPAQNFNGSDQLTFRVNDGTVNSQLATISIVITASNDAPLALASTLTTAGNTPVPIVLGGTDIEGSPLSYTIVAGPTNGSLSGTPPNVTYSPAINYTGSDSFTFRLNDGTANSANATVSITITSAPNTAPVASAKSVTTAEDTPLAVVLAGTDAEGDTLTYSVVTSPTKGILSGSAPNLTYTPSADATGSDSFTFRVNDGIVNSANATVSITITGVNDMPVATAKAATTAEDTPLPIVLTGTDKDADILSYSVVDGPSNGMLSGTPPNLTYSPAANFNGSDSFTFRVNDGTANSANATVSITVTAVNDTPVATGKSVTTAEDSPLAVVLAGTDVEGGPLTYSIVTGPTKGTLNGTPPNLTYIPVANSSGSDSFTYRVNDGTVNSANATVSITITPVNDTPVATAKSFTTTEETPLAMVLAGTDIEGSPLTYSVVIGPAKGTLSGSVPNLTYTPSADATGADSFTFLVNDGTVNSASATVSITITPVNDAPIALAKSVTATEDTPLAVVLVGTDAEGSPLTYSVVTGPTKGALSGTVPNLIYTPLANASGSDSFTFRVNDGTVNSANATVSITITPVNDTPVATAKTVTAILDTALSIVLSGSDVDSAALTYSIVSGPINGTLSGTPPNLTYLPNATFIGGDQFTFQVHDGTIHSSAATVSITVTSNPDTLKNTPPAFSKNPRIAAATEDTAYAEQLVASDSDKGDVLTFRKVSGPAWVWISADGVIGGTPSNSDVGTSALTVSVSDILNASATAILSLTVANTNDAPGFTLNPMVYPTGLEKTRYPDQTLTATATDPDAGDRLSYSKVSGPDWLTISKFGAVSGTPPVGSAGINLFTVRVTDAAGAFANSILQIEINSNSLPLPWKQQSLGTENVIGEASFSSGTFTLAGAGTLTAEEDSSNFGYQTLTGDGQITARVSKIDDTGAATNVGVMIRESLAPDARTAFLGVDGDGDMRWIRRVNTGGEATKNSKSARSVKKSGKVQDSWVRLVRKGNMITAFSSRNGTDWTRIGNSNLNLPKNCYIGLSVSSGNDSKLNTSKFTNVRVIQ